MTKRTESKNKRPEKAEERESKKSKTEDTAEPSSDVKTVVAIPPSKHAKPLVKKLNMPQKKKKKEPVDNQITEENMEKFRQSLQAAENEMPEADSK
jgi:hypothetical protein